MRQEPDTPGDQENHMELLPVGTKIRFTKTLEDGPNEEHPAIIYARKGDTGEITGHGCREGYWVTWDKWPAAFGASREEFEPISD